MSVPDPFVNVGEGRRKAAFFHFEAYREVNLCDFEFRQDPGCRPRVVCMVVRNLVSGNETRIWRDELLALRCAPFDTGPDSLFVAYFAVAELACFLELGWPLPTNVLDLFVERRVATNGLLLPPGANSLLGTLTAYGLAHIDAGEKESMRRLVMERWSWSDGERRALLDYCASDVEALAALLPRMADTIDWPRALLRGRYMAAVARMEHCGIPIDIVVHEKIASGWPDIEASLIAAVDVTYRVFEGTTFKADRFERLIESLGIAWPRLPSGHLARDRDTFNEQAKRYPFLYPLRELLMTRQAMSSLGPTVGPDGRNRCSLGPFRATTGRNAPSSGAFIYGPARWLRGEIKPPEGYGLAYIDFSSQEIAIAAALSGDERMMAGYLAGGPYLAFAKDAGLVPPDATRATHEAMRERCKVVVLGINYGMGPEAMARQAGITVPEARELLMLHKRTYPVFWRWIQSVLDAAMLTNEIQSVFGWRRQVTPETKPTSLMNFPMQANGAEMMRVAAIAATEAGIEVCAPVHDAFLIAAPLGRLDEQVEAMQAIMAGAGRVITRGLDVRTEAKIVRWPDRYMDERGQAMWDRVMSLLDRT